jgi:hypothetical protein
MAAKTTTARRRTKLDPKFSNKLPDWLNVVLVIGIFVTFCWGAKIFFDNFNPSGQHSYEAFFPAGLFTTFYFLLLAILYLFSNTDLANIMMVSLLVAGLILLCIGVFAKTESTKSNAFTASASILGLALGIPFGDKLRTSPVSNND